VKSRTFILDKIIRFIEKNPSFRRWEYIDNIYEVNSKDRMIDFIQQVLPKNCIGAEIGVFKGHLSPILLENTKASKLHLIDPWYFFKTHWNWAQGNQSTIDALRKILLDFKEEIENGRVKVHVGDDRQVLLTFPDQYFDWVYIDTTHQYEHTKQELQILASKVKDDGIISGDDWRPDPNHHHHGVYKAVNEFIADGKYSIIYSNDKNLQWAIKKV